MATWFSRHSTPTWNRKSAALADHFLGEQVDFVFWFCVFNIGTSLGSEGLHQLETRIMTAIMFARKPRYDEAAEAYEEGLKSSPGDAALGRGLDDVLKAQAASKAPAGESFTSVCLR